MPGERQNKRPEIWGGVECTINRVRDQFFDQLLYSQHYDRQADIDLIADLGIKKIRYPILWEKHQPEKNKVIDWSISESKLQLLKEKNIDVIAGLVHHGSGPVFTNLLDPQFPYLLAEYARKVAEKFPWLCSYTPINEPLTTARFSGLYGLWYPHLCNDKYFATILLNQLKGVVLSMQEIRKVNPQAQLIQTEDLGKTYSTKKLRYQARFENERRWLTFDLLSGKVDENHKLWKYFKRLKIPEKNLRFFQENKCVPDIFGFNHYVTSERFLDENLSSYPSENHGGNGRHYYADIEASRVEIEEENGIEILLKEAWQRYEKPMAITEVHLHCHREEQLRWFKYVLTACDNLQKTGIDIRGITAWAMLGSFGWNKLLTQPCGEYEPGVFDIRGGKPRPTALAKFIKELNQTNSEMHPVAHEDGWWLRNSRLIFQRNILNRPHRHILQGSHKPVLIIGKHGALGAAFSRICHDRFIPYASLGRDECDITNRKSIDEAINLYKPWAIINAAGYNKIDDAESDPHKCFNENSGGPKNLAEACLQFNIKLLSYSSDLVFDGAKQEPYLESDTVNPLSIFGKSKVQSEENILMTHPDSLIIRTSALFGPWDESNFPHYIIDSLSRQQQVTVANDLFHSPTYIPDLVNTSLDLLIDDEKGIWHLTNKGVVSWSEWAYEIAGRWGVDDMFINSLPAKEINLQAVRPVFSALSSEKAILLPTLENALQRFFIESKISVSARSII